MAKIGRPVAIETPEQLEELAGKYFEWSDKNPIIQEVSHVKNGVQELKIRRPYSQEGFAGFIGHTRKTIFIELKDRVEFLPTISRIQNIIDTQHFEYAGAGVFNARIIAFKLGLNDKQEEQKKTNIVIVTKESDSLNQILNDNK